VVFPLSMWADMPMLRMVERSLITAFLECLAA